MSKSPPAVSVHNLAVNYGNYTAIAGVSFDLAAGEFLAVVGPNGAGKTTLIRCLLGLVSQRKGSIRLFDHAPEQHDPARISYVPQIKGLDRSFPAKAIEVVVSGLRRSWPWRISADERAAALEVMERLQIGDLAEKPVAKLSGGQLQRVYLARGLVRKPELVVFDEPATGIDAPGEAKLYVILDEYRADTNATIIMITHDWAVARHHASQVLLLNRIQVGFGPPREVLVDDKLSAAFGHAGHRHPMSIG